MCYCLRPREKPSRIAFTLSTLPNSSVWGRIFTISSPHPDSQPWKQTARPRCRHQGSACVSLKTNKLMKTKILQKIFLSLITLVFVSFGLSPRTSAADHNYESRIHNRVHELA